MRTNIETGDKLMQKAMRSGGFKTNRETVEAALKALSERHIAYRKLLNLVGKGEFDAAYDYKTMRSGNPPALKK